MLRLFFLFSFYFIFLSSRFKSFSKFGIQASLGGAINIPMEKSKIQQINVI